MSGRQEESVASSGAAGGRAEDGAATVGANANVLSEAADGAKYGADEYGGGYRPLKIAAIYARVSTERQEKEQTVESQLDALHRAAEEGGYEVSPSYVFVDERHSGAHLDRPGLDRLRDLASEGSFEAVLIAAPDRLARHYAYQVIVVEELQKAGCEVVFTNHSFGDTPEERMLLQIQGVFAEYERALIKERTRRGRLFAARQGKVHWSYAPYGYRLIHKTENSPQKIVVDETEAEVVRQIFRWCVEDRMTCYAIEKLLREQGVPTRKGRELGWCQSTVGNILRNSVYKGVGYYNRRKRVDAKRPVNEKGFKDLRPGNLRGRAERPEEEWIEVRVPALVDPEAWDLAQEQLQKNRNRAKRNNTKHHYLLRSLVVCGVCGKRMIGAWMETGRRYVCADRYPRHAPWACDGRSVMARDIEPLVWEYIQELLADPELLKARYEEGRADPAVESEQEREKVRIERKLRALEREVGRLIDAYQAEVIDLPELKERRERIEEHGRMLKQRLSEIGQKRARREQEVRLLQGLEEFSDSVRESLEDPSFETKQQVLQLVVDRIVVEDAKVVIHHVVPAGPVGLQTEQQPEVWADWEDPYQPLYREAFEAELRPVEAVVEALDRIDGMALSICVASSGTHEKMRNTLGITGLQARFEGCIFSSEEVENGKPAPDLFLHAAERMGIEPASCVVVEDSFHGVEAARSAGMCAFGYAGGLTPADRLQGPGTVVFDDMRKLPGLLAAARRGPGP